MERQAGSHAPSIPPQVSRPQMARTDSVTQLEPLTVDDNSRTMWCNVSQRVKLSIKACFQLAPLFTWPPGLSAFGSLNRRTNHNLVYRSSGQSPLRSVDHQPIACVLCGPPANPLCALWTTSQSPVCSPDLQALRRKAKAKERAALEPTLARPSTPLLAGGRGLQAQRHTRYSLCYWLCCTGPCSGNTDHPSLRSAHYIRMNERKSYKASLPFKYQVVQSKLFIFLRGPELYEQLWHHSHLWCHKQVHF